MPARRRRKRSTRILKAASSNLRLQILNFLFERGTLSYTEMMNLLKLSPSRDAGRFAYHLKELLGADLVEPDPQTKKYRLTDLGKLVLSVTEEIEKRTYRRRRMMVRTSRLSIEEFDRNKIVNALMKEASVPGGLAQKIAREAEKRLQEFKTKYLTAPLIREIVNAILVEKGLEEYRHKLTRLGLPVHDVTQLIQRIGGQGLSVETVRQAAGDAVFEEYTLLNVLPRDVADAHISGYLHLKNLGSWILKTDEAFHDVRYFLRNGLNLGKSSFYSAPKSLQSALLMVSSLLKAATREVSEEQAIDYFNVFLAPYLKNVAADQAKEALRIFVHDLNQFLSHRGLPVPASLGLETDVPSFLLEKEAVGPGGESSGTYAEFREEAQAFTSLLLDVLKEESRNSFFTSPSVLVKLRDGSFEDASCEHILLKAHELAAETGLPYFVNLRGEQGLVSYSATGCRLADDWKGDCELDTLRTGNLGTVFINLPRLTYDANGDESVFFRLLDERLEMAVRALEIKHRAMRKRAYEGLLPFLTQKLDGDRYFRMENSSRNVSFVGLNEAVQSLSGKMLHESNDALQLANKIVKYILRYTRRLWRKMARALPSMTSSAHAAQRLAELDLEKYGWGRVKAQGGKENPIYTEMVAIPLNVNVSWKERLKIEGEFHRTCPGGHLSVIQIADVPLSPEELLSTTRHIVTSYNIGFFAYNRNVSYCSRCRGTSFGLLPKCPSCGSTDNITRFSRLSAKYLPLTRASSIANTRVSYVLTSE